MDPEDFWALEELLEPEAEAEDEEDLMMTFLAEFCGETTKL